jgi:molecular chaperone DnaK (HSP70)
VERFTLIKHDQNTVKIEIFQDHLGGARYTSQTTPTGIKGTITNIPPSESGTPHPVDVAFTYNEDGIIEITASIPTTGQKSRSVPCVGAQDERCGGENR